MVCKRVAQMSMTQMRHDDLARASRLVAYFTGIPRNVSLMEQRMEPRSRTLTGGIGAANPGRCGAIVVGLNTVVPRLEMAAADVGVAHACTHMRATGAEAKRVDPESKLIRSETASGMKCLIMQRSDTIWFCFDVEPSRHMALRQAPLRFSSHRGDVAAASGCSFEGGSMQWALRWCSGCQYSGMIPPIDSHAKGSDSSSGGTVPAA